MVYTGQETHIEFESATWIPAAISSSADLEGDTEDSYEIVSNMYAPVGVVRGLWDTGEGMLVVVNMDSIEGVTLQFGDVVGATRISQTLTQSHARAKHCPSSRQKGMGEINRLGELWPGRAMSSVAGVG